MNRILSVFLSQVLLACCLAGAAGSVRANAASTNAVPTVVSYQGKVTISGQPYNGAGYFKFAILNQAGTTSY
jgi:hypothetical protein